MRLILLLGLIFGFEFAYALPTAEVRCMKQDCLKDGWTTRIPRQGRMTITNCVAGDCAQNGWRTQDRGMVLDVYCMDGGCFKTGWTEVANNGYRNNYYCDIDVLRNQTEPDCFKHGWTGTGPGSRESSVCIDDDCTKNGWVIELPYGRQGRAICRVGYDEETKKNVSNCFRFGWDQFD